MDSLPPDSLLQRARAMRAACGYMELGLPDMALEELDGLSDETASDPEVRELRLLVLLKAQSWEAAIAVGRDLCADAPERDAAWIHTAFACHEMGRTHEARDLLLAAPDSVRDDPLFHYNLGCYLAVLGEARDAEVSLRLAFRRDPALKHFARTDPDLRSLGPLDHL